MKPNENNPLIDIRRVRAIAFDCDGVLFDSADANKAYYNRILDRFGKPPMTGEQFAYTHMHTARESLRYLFPDNGLLPGVLAFSKELTYMPFIRLMKIEPDLKPLMKRIKPCYPTAIATNRTDTMGRVLETHGLEDQFDLVVTALDVENPKPEPDSLYRVANHFQIQPDELMYVGDSTVDEQAARAAGVIFVAYDNPSLYADIYISSLKEMLTIFKL